MRNQVLAGNVPNITFDQAHRSLRGRALERFVFAWIWSAPRYGGVPGAKHEGYYRRHGGLHYWQRIDQVRRALGLPPYPNCPITESRPGDSSNTGRPK